MYPTIADCIREGFLVLCFVLLCVAAFGCTPAARAIGSQLGMWAIEKAARYGECVTMEDSGTHAWSRSRALECLGPYAPNKGTPYCPATDAWLAEHPPAD